ncbi:hypothetical protein CCS38_10325 [Streptomyces purpurogeneiscleroticus]|nr:hypothetical protein [Streptomyces purpurogeneiscleroticus]
MEQAQEFMEAAEGAGPATRPVQIFYSLSQFGRAIAAASSLLHDGEWRLKAHGIGTRNLDTSLGLCHVEVEPHARGAFVGIARAIGAEPLPAKERLALGELWPLLPEAQSVVLPGSGSVPVLHFAPVALVHREEKRWCRLSLLPVPSLVRDKTEEDPARLDEFLGHYPSLAGWSHTPDVPDSIIWKARDDRPGEELEIFLPSRLGRAARHEEGAEEALARATEYRGSRDFYAFPKLGSMSEPIHPLLAWWAVLFGLSILARYEPEAWAATIDIDRSPSANAVEHLLEQATAVVPHLALLAIKDVASR